MPLRRHLSSLLSTCRAIGFRARLRRCGTLPELLALLARHYAREADARGMGLELEIDPALAPDLSGPIAPLGDALRRLLDESLTQRTWRIALHVDVVGDDASSQMVHFTVADEATVRGPGTDDRLREAAASIAAYGGVIHVETGDDIGSRAIVEIGFDLPRPAPRIDVASLRQTLGGDDALRQVIVALDEALSSDLAGLDALLAAPGVAALRAWLHRVSGALGMAEASDLARIGLTLERDLQRGRDAQLDRAIRRFAHDAAQILATLREHATPMRYSPAP